MNKLLCLLPVLAFCGCAVSTPHPTSLIFTPQGMEAIGNARGVSSGTRLFCVIPLDGTASLADAMENAARSSGSDVIVNPAVDDERGVGFLGLWCWQKIKVYGLAVRFKRGASQQPPRAQATVQPQQPAAARPRDEKNPGALPSAVPGDPDMGDLEKRMLGGGKQ